MLGKLVGLPTGANNDVMVIISNPKWSSGWRACHWTQGSQVKTRPRAMDFKGDKKLQHAFLRRGSKAAGPNGSRFDGMLDNTSKYERAIL
jgi:hypothetical protein